MRYLLVLMMVSLWSSLAVADERDVPLRGSPNTRSLAGLPVSGGTVRAGRIYRSARLCHIKDADVARLQGLGLSTIVDLRDERELSRDGPDRPELTRGVPHLVVNSMMSQTAEGGPVGYGQWVSDCHSQVGLFFRLLARDDSYPLLFHCTAGKDRTGVLTALLLEFLGASRELIVEDYLLSGRVPSYQVDRAWISSAFQVVDRAGGIKPYLRECQITETEMGDIRRLLVEQK